MKNLNTLILLGLPLLLKNLSPKTRFDATAGLAAVLGAVDLNTIRDKVYEHLENAPVTLGMNRNGTYVEVTEVGNIDERIQIMQNVIRESISDPVIRSRAASLVKNIRPGQDEKELQAVFRFIKNNVRFTEEPGEIFQDSSTSLKLGIGDCDDMVILASSLMYHLAFPLRIRVVGTKGDQDFSHVYLLVGTPKNNPQKWISFDPSVDRPLGWDIQSEKKITMEKEYEI